MIVKVELSPYEMWRIEAEAESKGMTLSEFVRNAAVALVRGDLMKDPLRELHAIGMCDADIGMQLGLNVAVVKRRRVRLGLPAHRRFAVKAVAEIPISSGISDRISTAPRSGMNTRQGLTHESNLPIGGLP